MIGKAGFLTRRSLSGDDRTANNLTLPSSLRQFLLIEVLGRRILYWKCTSTGKIVAPALAGRTNVTRSENLGNRTGGRSAWRMAASVRHLRGSRSASLNGSVEDP